MPRSRKKRHVDIVSSSAKQCPISPSSNIIACIMAFLHQRERFRIAPQVSKLWKAAAQTRLLWQEIVITEEMTTEDRDTLLQRMIQYETKTLRIDRYSDLGGLSWNACKLTFPALQNMIIPRGFINRDVCFDLYDWMKKCPELKSMILENGCVDALTISKDAQRKWWTNFAALQQDDRVLFPDNSRAMDCTKCKRRVRVYNCSTPGHHDCRFAAEGPEWMVCKHIMESLNIRGADEQEQCHCCGLHYCKASKQVAKCAHCESLNCGKCYHKCICQTCGGKLCFVHARLVKAEVRNCWSRLCGCTCYRLVQNSS
jgi:hypothetical protein